MVMVPGGGASSLGPSNDSTTQSPSSLGGGGSSAFFGAGAARVRARPRTSGVIGVDSGRGSGWFAFSVIRRGSRRIAPRAGVGRRRPVSYSTPDGPARFNFREIPVRPLAILLLAAAPAAAAARLVLFAAGLRAPFGMDFRDGQMVVAEFGGHRVIALDKDGKATVLAGSGRMGFADGVGEKAEFNATHNLAVAPDGAIYVADTLNHRVRKLDPKTGMVTTIAGGGKGFAGDGRPAKDARFNEAYHVALEPGGKALFVCALGNRRIRRIDLAA